VWNAICPSSFQANQDRRMDYIMETFPIVKRKDEKLHGEYRTKRVILEMYDEMTRAMELGEVYRTRLVPGDRAVAHEVRMGAGMHQ
jgi:hypothetical protein